MAKVPPRQCRLGSAPARLLRLLRARLAALAGSVLRHRPTNAQPAMPRYLPPTPQARALVTVLLHGATEHLAATEGTDGLRMLKTRLDRHFEDLD